MDNLLNEPVGAVGSEGAAGDGSANPSQTATAGGSATQGVATPTLSLDEVQKLVEAERVKQEQNIARLKSTYDKREAQLKREADQRDREFSEKLKALELRGMDDAQRKAYEEEHRNDETQRLATEKAQLEKQLADFQVMQNSQKFFLDNGVPLSQLDLENGPEALAASGWQAMQARTLALQKELEEIKKGKPAGEKEIKQPPDTITHGSIQANQTSLVDAIKKYAGGDEDRFYSMIEKGQIPASILNLPKEA
jgi:hypothetical protein